MNVSDETWPLVLGWLVAAFIPEIPHPILMLGGLQGAGKTSAARFLVGVFDPSPAQQRSPPKEPEQWAIAAAGSWGVAVDNVSSIPAWWSDALCKAVTGDGWVRRKLYTDGELAVVSFRRVVALTSIDAGSLRGDLGDRLLLVELDEIEDFQRKDEALLMRSYEERHALILGAVLDLLGQVLQELPRVILPAQPRMIDFARVQAAVDALVGADGLARYLRQGERIAGDVLDGDPVATTIMKLMESEPAWRGSATSLYARLTPEKPPRDWPKTAPALSGRLKRLAPALKTVGVRVVHTRDSSRDRPRFIEIGSVAENAVRTVRPSEDAGSACTEADSQEPAPDGDRTASDGAAPGGPSGAEAREWAGMRIGASAADAPDGSDGNSRPSSGREVIKL